MQLLFHRLIKKRDQTFMNEKTTIESLERCLLTAEAVEFLSALHRQFNSRREALLEAREERQVSISFGELPGFLETTRSIREAEWTVRETPSDLVHRRVEITGPVEAKMMINALNSGACTFMADLEDSTSPTWFNILCGHQNLIAAVRHELAFDADNGKRYRLNEKTATLLVRPRGWHLDEEHFLVDDVPISASLFDFGLYFFHNAAEAIARGTGPYFYLPKLENHEEARLWNDVFVWAQQRIGVEVGTICTTVLIENILAAFEMDEILFELKDHIVGLNAGRWDYIFSIIKKFREYPDRVLPDRSAITMSVGFMQAYCRLLVKTCHRRNAHAIGGMSAFIPSRKDQDVNARALAQVGMDKRREAQMGFDGSWVAHPDLVAVAWREFEERFEGAFHQKDFIPADCNVSASELLDFEIEGGSITRAGFEKNISVALQYLANWLNGQGAVAIDNLMEDAATAEISRAQLWQWVKHSARFSDDGAEITVDEYRLALSKVKWELSKEIDVNLELAAELLDWLVDGEEFEDFLTLVAGLML